MTPETFIEARARNLAAGGQWFADEPPGTWPILEPVIYRGNRHEVLPGGYILTRDEKMRYRRRKRKTWNIYRIDARGRLRFQRGGWWKRLEAVEVLCGLARSAERRGSRRGPQGPGETKAA